MSEYKNTQADYLNLEDVLLSNMHNKQIHLIVPNLIYQHNLFAMNNEVGLQYLPRLIKAAKLKYINTCVNNTKKITRDNNYIENNVNNLEHLNKTIKFSDLFYYYQYCNTDYLGYNISTQAVDTNLATLIAKKINVYTQETIYVLADFISCQASLNELIVNKIDHNINDKVFIDIIQYLNQEFLANNIIFHYIRDTTCLIAIKITDDNHSLINAFNNFNSYLSTLDIYGMNLYQNYIKYSYPIHLIKFINQVQILLNTYNLTHKTIKSVDKIYDYYHDSANYDINAINIWNYNTTELINNIKILGQQINFDLVKKISNNNQNNILLLSNLYITGNSDNTEEWLKAILDYDNTIFKKIYELLYNNQLNKVYIISPLDSIRMVNPTHPNILTIKITKYDKYLFYRNNTFKNIYRQFN